MAAVQRQPLACSVCLSQPASFTRTCLAASLTHTRPASLQARAKELKNELLNSQRLAAFFEEHPQGEAGPGWQGS